MAMETKNLGLYLEDNSGTKFKEWRDKMNGPTGSNMEKLDDAVASKQDKLTGTQGQVVGFDENGNAVPQAAPDTGVTTFNGRTGAVTPQSGDYTAAQVGARPNTWTPTAADVGASPTGHKHGKSEITDFPTSMPASDVSAWAKSPSKPSYTASEVGAAGKPLTGSVTIPTSGWSSDSTATYPKYYDIAVSGVTASDRANVDIAPSSLSVAVACGLCPATETIAGKIRLRSVNTPTAAMTANYLVEKGA